MSELIRLSKENLEFAEQRFQLIRPYFNGGISQKQLARDLGVPLPTIKRWIQKYQKFGLAGLAHKRRRDEGQPRIRLEIQHLIQGLALRNPPPSTAWIHRTVEKIGIAHGWETPSYSSVVNIIGAMDRGLRTLAQEGDKVYQEAFEMLHRRQTTAPNEIWQADHCLLKLFLLNAQGKPQRPWLTIILDDFSRTVAGFNLSFRAPSAINTSLALRHAIWRKADPRWRICGIPETFYTDHGSDFTSRHMEQVGIHLHMELIFSTVGKPRGRGRIERFFRTVRQLLLADLPGYAPRGRLLTLPSLTLEAFNDIFREWLLGTYHTRQHSGTGEPPQALWESSGFLPNLPEFLSDLDMLLTFTTTRIVQQDGIRFNDFWFQDLTLSAYIGEQVTVRYDPDDITELRIYHREKFLCRAVCCELAGASISLREIINARRSRKRELKQIIQERQTLVDRFMNVRRGMMEVKVVPKVPPIEESGSQPPSVRKLKRYLHE